MTSRPSILPMSEPQQPPRTQEVQSRARSDPQSTSSTVPFLGKLAVRRWLRRRRARGGAAFGLLKRRFALNVMAHRRQRGWTQRALASACGWEQCRISLIERGRVSPRRKILRTLCFVFQCEEGALLRNPPEQLQWIEVAPVPARSHLIPEALAPVSSRHHRRRRFQPRWDGPYVPRLAALEEIAAWATDDLDDRVSEEWDRDFDYGDVIAECDDYRRQLDELDLP